MSKIYRPVIPIWIEEKNMRLIDADALMEECYEELEDGSLWHDEDTSKDYADGHDEGKRIMMAIIDQAPTIDLTDRLDEAYACGYTDAEAKFYNPVVYGEWIPCSEKLPDATVTYYLISTNRDAVDIGWWSGSNWESFSDAEVIAWTPLPEPYKEGE